MPSVSASSHARKDLALPLSRTPAVLLCSQQMRWSPQAGSSHRCLPTPQRNLIVSFLPNPETIARAVGTAAGDGQTDGILVVLAPQAMTDPVATAEHIAKHARSGRPLIAQLDGR